jgi:hypothetical protein
LDPVTGDLYLVTRDRDADRDGFASVFRYPAPLVVGVKKTLELVARFSAPNQIKGGDISEDGNTIILRPHSYHRRAKALRWTWDRKRTIAQVFANPGTEIPVAPERQGEAIAISPDGRSYYTIGEGLNAPIYHYALP